MDINEAAKKNEVTGEISEAVQENEVTEKINETVQKSKAAKKRKPGAVIAIILSLLLVMGALTWLFLTRCKVPTCFQKAEKGRYCLDHACSVSGCNNPRVNQLSQYCEVHTCHVPGCFQLASGGKYCSTHTCKEARCTELVKSGRKYCEKHDFNYKTDLVLEDLQLNTTRKSAVITFWVTNKNSNHTYKEVKVNVVLKNDYYSVIRDVDVVATTSLAPGERRLVTLTFDGYGSTWYASVGFVESE